LLNSWRLQRLKIDHTAWVLAVAFSPDGTRLTTTSGDSARIWDTITGRQQLQVNHTKSRAGRRV
jgi:WD40 repeat protein